MTDRTDTLHIVGVLAVLCACGSPSADAPQLNPEPLAAAVSAAGDTSWPLTVDQGTLRCEPLGTLGIVTFESNGATYAVNGTAKDRMTKHGWHDIQEIWKANPEIPGTKIPIGDFLNRGLKLCTQQGH